MRHDPEKRVAVFLGPSLEREFAETILSANYHPPVRFGDVYRLITSGTSVICLIDGVFHGDTPVWQREILAALRAGITVVGAASMGALRAAETAPWGTMGCGQVYEWYRNGEIDGDDEVALLHADESGGYAAMSEPLVNIRFNLRRAVAKELITSEQADSLVDEAKRAYFGDRTHAALLAGAAARRLDEETRGRLAVFLRDDAADVKRDDAIEGLRTCARLLDGEPTPSPARTDWQMPVVRDYYERGALRDGELVRVEELLAASATDGAWLGPASEQASIRIFLLQELVDRGLEPPRAQQEAFRARWLAEHVAGSVAEWLSANALTAEELETSLDERAAVEWMLAGGADELDLLTESHCRAVDAVRSVLGDDAPPRETLLRDARASCLVAAWAERRGISRPPGLVEKHIGDWRRARGIHDLDGWLASVRLDADSFRSIWGERALFHWMVELGPQRFGLGPETLELELLRDLQLTGGLARVEQRQPPEAGS